MVSGIKLNIRRMNPMLFEWSLWRTITPFDVMGSSLRLSSLVQNKAAIKRLKKAAVGWCPGDLVSTRTRNGWNCVMFFVDGEHGWFHMRKEEFDLVFEEEKQK